MPERVQGTVKWFDEDKGYGFIDCDECENDVFIHHSDIDESGYTSLREEQDVEFEIVDTEKGKKAQNLTKMSTN